MTGERHASTLESVGSVLGATALALVRVPLQTPSAQLLMHRSSAKVLTAVAIVFLCAARTLAAAEALSAATYVGSRQCESCHSGQTRAWQGSHHDLAMQEAKPGAVLGDFGGTEFSYGAVTSRFSRRGDAFFVRTDGPDGKLADFEIAYAFGVDPLQQYLIAMPGGRLQALSVAWDARPRTAGGQRWFHLYPNERVAFDDELHWTRRAQNWNHMCAECHSTGFEKRYDETARAYESRWAEIDVACEACHGPASRHLAWARKDVGWEAIGEKGIVVPLDERRGVAWVIDPATGNASRSVARSTEVEIETCGRCHARRSQLFEDDASVPGLTSSYLPALLREGIYHADGQIDAEDYEYGSFVQSRMYQAGVTCSDCHEPHGLALRAPGDAVCFQCHAAGKYASTGHHFHEAGSPGGHCTGCHMPAKTYMVVDERHDHAFRVPRPDSSATLGTPNACAACHAPQTAEWAAEQVRRWLGRDARGMQRYGAELHAARKRTADAEASLVALLENASQPAIARATAAAELGGWLSPRSLGAVGAALRDPSPLVRIGALEALEAVPPEERWRRAEHLLADPARVVRALAASALAEPAASGLSVEQKEALARGADEYVAAQRFNGDQPESSVNLGNFLAARGQAAQADSAYRRAIEIDPSWVPAYVNLADLLRATGRDAEGEAVLAEGLRRAPEAAALHHSRGLLLVRQNRRDVALEELGRAVDLEPENGRFAYVYAIALDSAGRRGEARDVLSAALGRTPADRALLALQAQLSR